MKKTILTTLMMLLVSNVALAANLDQIANRLVRRANNVKMAIQDMEYSNGTRQEVRQSVRDLKRVLNRLEDQLRMNPSPNPSPNPYPNPYPNPISSIQATCTLDVGGNFFTPETKVECSVYGRNAAGYEVRVISEYGSQIKFQGRLDPNLGTQTFKTREKKVGGRTVRYEVFILTTQGQRFLVESL